MAILAPKSSFLLVTCPYAKRIIRCHEIELRKKPSFYKTIKQHRYQWNKITIFDGDGIQFWIFTQKSSPSFFLINITGIFAGDLDERMTTKAFSSMIDILYTNPKKRFFAFLNPNGIIIRSKLRQYIGVMLIKHIFELSIL